MLIRTPAPWARGTHMDQARAFRTTRCRRIRHPVRRRTASSGPLECTIRVHALRSVLPDAALQVLQGTNILDTHPTPPRCVRGDDSAEFDAWLDACTGGYLSPR